jgi:hypothetical protein
MHGQTHQTCLKAGSSVEYLDLKESKEQQQGENCMRNFKIYTFHLRINSVMKGETYGTCRTHAKF